ncbi:uncharacterized protein EV420DRAFT_1488647 [Desarmillaria tabescens]|uniref:Uncharacterized protein n=1 Tax=Armillaria tabescens TaxID=1929756 RepID=A0AA39J1I1_ARMTA|nr:uncharacterized protein EV420DRAFT_1488647 [Desarmillaria tabescens]KAK0434410.1 hypothetical protein EV420DRAFT_1488647 [Desarmillaria tabescens]
MASVLHGKVNLEKFRIGGTSLYAPHHVLSLTKMLFLLLERISYYYNSAEKLKELSANPPNSTWDSADTNAWVINAHSSWGKYDIKPKEKTPAPPASRQATPHCSPSKEKTPGPPPSQITMPASPIAEATTSKAFVTIPPFPTLEEQTASAQDLFDMPMPPPAHGIEDQGVDPMGPPASNDECLGLAGPSSMLLGWGSSAWSLLRSQLNSPFGSPNLSSSSVFTFRLPPDSPLHCSVKPLLVKQSLAAIKASGSTAINSSNADKTPVDTSSTHQIPSPVALQPDIEEDTTINTAKNPLPIPEDKDMDIDSPPPARHIVKTLKPMPNPVFEDSVPDNDDTIVIDSPRGLHERKKSKDNKPCPQPVIKMGPPKGKDKDAAVPATKKRKITIVEDKNNDKKDKEEFLEEALANSFPRVWKKCESSFCIGHACALKGLQQGLCMFNGKKLLCPYILYRSDPVQYNAIVGTHNLINQYMNAIYWIICNIFLALNLQEHVMDEDTRVEDMEAVSNEEMDENGAGPSTA